jgi:hypothetical protein
VNPSLYEEQLWFRDADESLTPTPLVDRKHAVWIDLALDDADQHAMRYSGRVGQLPQRKNDRQAAVRKWLCISPNCFDEIV